MRRPADAARIEEAGAVAVAAVQIEREIARPLDEKWPPLGKEVSKPLRLTTAGSAST
jgi:hypothetical protein